MTTTIKITTNGAYVARGTIKIGDGNVESIEVGPGNMVEWSTGVPHGSKVTLELEESPAGVDAEGRGRQRRRHPRAGRRVIPTAGSAEIPRSARGVLRPAEGTHALASGLLHLRETACRSGARRT